MASMDTIASETIALRVVTVIGGQRYEDDYQVIWRGDR